MAWRQTIIWTNADAIHWRIYAALGEDELSLLHKSLCFMQCHKLYWYHFRIFMILDGLIRHVMTYNITKMRVGHTSNLDSQKTLHTPPWWISYMVSIVGILKEKQLQQQNSTIYCIISNIICPKSPNLNVSRLLSLPNAMKPGVKSRMKM